MSYEPRPGSTAHRVIAHLETLPHGAEVLTSTIASALGMQANSIPTCMEGALAAGAVFRRKRDPHLRAPLYWSLVNHARANGHAPAASNSAMSASLADDIETVIAVVKDAQQALLKLVVGDQLKRLAHLTSGADMEALVVDLMGERQVLRDLLAECRHLIQNVWQDSDDTHEAERLYLLRTQIDAALHPRATPVEMRVAEARRQRVQQHQTPAE